MIGDKERTAIHVSIKDSISFENEGFHSIAFLAATLIENQFINVPEKCNLGIQFMPTVPFIFPGFSFNLIGHVRDIKIANNLVWVLYEDFYGSTLIEASHNDHEICKNLFDMKQKGYFDCMIVYDGAKTAKIVAHEVRSLNEVVTSIELARTIKP